MTIKELKEQIENLPDDLIVCVEKNTIVQEKSGFVTETNTIEAKQLQYSKIWIKNEDPILRIHSYQKDCVVLK